MNNLFNSKRGVRGLIILLVGIIILTMLGLVLFKYYERINRRNIGVPEARRLIMSWVVMANHSRNPQLRKVIKVENRSWLRVKISRNADAKAQLIDASDIWAVQQVLQNKKVFHLSLKLKRHGYLNINGRKPSHLSQNTVLLFCLIVLLLLLVILCYWVIQYISTPLDPLINAVERFSYDIKAPNILEQGSEEMRTVIRAFNAMQDNLRSLLEGRTQMLAAISHDLRTPITRLKLRAEMLEDEKIQVKVLRDLNDMESMIASILAFARQQNSDEAEQTFDLNGLVESICNDFEDMGKAVTFQSNTQRLSFSGRMVNLKRALTNLIENAIKYGQTCEVTLMKHDDKIHLTIQDHGPGIPEDKLEQVFKPFYRVDHARTPNVGGSGLGLTTVAEIIHSQGGEVQLKNNEQGLLVTVVL